MFEFFLGYFIGREDQRHSSHGEIVRNRQCASANEVWPVNVLICLVALLVASIIGWHLFVMVKDDQSREAELKLSRAFRDINIYYQPSARDFLKSLAEVCGLHARKEGLNESLACLRDAAKKSGGAFTRADVDPVEFLDQLFESNSLRQRI